MTDLLVVGDCCADVVIGGRDVTPVFGDVESLVDSGVLAIGGSSTITACGAARLGLDTALVTRLGDDLLGSFLRGAVAGRGVDTAAVLTDPGASTGMSVILARPADRAILTALGTIERLRADDVPGALVASCRHLHVGAYYLQGALRPGLRALLQAARAAGATTSLDPNWDPSERWDGIEPLLDVLDVLFVNEREAAALGGAAAPAARGPTVVVKQGPAGATEYGGAGMVHVPAPDVEVVDSIGAGDSFSAGYLCGRLGGAGAEASLALGCACGGLSTRAVGGTAGQPDLQEAAHVAGGLRTSA